MFLPEQLKGEVRVNFMHLRGEIVKLDDKMLREFVWWIYCHCKKKICLLPNNDEFVE